ncbi:hypothetical protein AAOGI_14560 [Agarivorans albus]
MSKLFKLKEFFTLEDSSEYLSTAIEEPVSLADLYQLSLDGHLTISVRFIESAFAELGCINDASSAEPHYCEIPFDLVTKQKVTLPQLIPVFANTNNGENESLMFSKESYSIGGIWDLAMIGSEVTEIERLYQKASSEQTLVKAKKAPIYVSDGDIFGRLKLAVKPDKSEFQLMVDFKLDKEAESRKVLNMRGLSEDDFFDFVENRGDKAKGEFVSFIEKEGDKGAAYLTNSEIMSVYEWAFGKGLPYPKHTYVNSTSLECHNLQLVIRTRELTRFVTSLQDNNQFESSKNKVLQTKERNTYLTLIAALFKELKIEPSVRGVTPAISSITETAGTPISENTIRKILNDVVDMKQ